MSETIFITGFPGFIAGKLVDELRLAYDNPQFYFLVHPTQVKRAQELISSRDKIISGDLCDLVVDSSVIENTTHVFHLAAVYDLSVARDFAYRVNVEGTKHVLDLCRQMRNLKRLNYISTCYVSGSREGMIFEDELECGQKFKNFYEETKYLAEVEVTKLKNEIPISIYRPAIVVGDSKTGVTIKYDGPYFVIRFLLRWAKVSRLMLDLGYDEAFVNVVPVDFIVRAISSLSKNPNAVGKTFQLADPHPPSSRELFDFLCRECGLSNPIKMDFLKPVVMPLLKTPLGNQFTHIPKEAFHYFSHKARYSCVNTTQAGIVPPFYKTYFQKLTQFVKLNPNL